MSETHASAGPRDMGPHDFDPWEGRPASRSDQLVDPEAPPAGWYRLSKPTRLRIGGEAVKLLAEQGKPESIHRAAHELWARVRVDREADKDLSIRELSGPVSVLTEVLQKLTIAGDIIATIEARAERDHAQLCRIVHIRGLAPCQAPEPPAAGAAA